MPLDVYLRDVSNDNGDVWIGQNRSNLNVPIITNVTELRHNELFTVTVNSYSSLQNIFVNGYASTGLTEDDATNVSGTATINGRLGYPASVIVEDSSGNSADYGKTLLPQTGYNYCEFLVDSANLPPNSVFYQSVAFPVGTQATFEAVTSLGDILELDGYGVPILPLQPGTHVVSCYLLDPDDNYAASPENDLTIVIANTTPSPFNFDDVVDAIAGDEYRSTKAVSGLPSNATMYVTGGLVSNDGGGSWTDNPILFVAGQSLVRAVGNAGVNPNDIVNVQVTLNGYTDTFTITTTSSQVDFFNLGSKFNQPTSTLVSSDPFTPTGAAGTYPISIDVGEYSIDGAQFTSSPGTFTIGSSVVVRVISSQYDNDPITVNLTIDSTTGPFYTTTAKGGVNAPYFYPQSGVPLSSLRTSNTYQVTGDTPGTYPISVAGGEYSINGAPFTTSAGNVDVGDLVQVRQISSSSQDVETVLELFVGGAISRFSVTTQQTSPGDPVWGSPAYDNLPLYYTPTNVVWTPSIASGSGDYTFSLNSGSLGLLTLNPSTGVISGNLIGENDIAFSILCTDNVTSGTASSGVINVALEPQVDFDLQFLTDVTPNQFATHPDVPVTGEPGAYSFAFTLKSPPDVQVEVSIDGGPFSATPPDFIIGTNSYFTPRIMAGDAGETVSCRLSLGNRSVNFQATAADSALVNVDDLTISPTISSPSLFQEVSLSPDGLSIISSITSPALSSEASIQPENLTINSSLSNATITIEGQIYYSSNIVVF